MNKATAKDLAWSKSKFRGLGHRSRISFCSRRKVKGQGRGLFLHAPKNFRVIPQVSIH